MIIYKSTWFYPGEYVVDCEEHGYATRTTLFSDALGRALIHRFEEDQ